MPSKIMPVSHDVLIRDRVANPIPATSGRPVWVKSMPFIGIIAMFSGLGVHAVGAPRDPDTWWHLRAGDYLWQTWSFAAPEPWNRFSSRPWVLHEWLPELLASKVAKVGGIPGLAWLMCVALAALLVLLYLVARRWADPLVASVAAAGGIIGMGGGLSLRPQLVTFMLLVVFMGTWLVSARDLRPRWWLVPLTWLWACSHGMWFCGVIVGMATVLGIVLDRSATRKQLLRLGLVPVLGVAAAAITPVGPKLLLTPLTVNQYTEFVTEWLPPNVRQVAPAVTLCMIAAVVTVWARSRQPIPWSHVFLLIIATGWTLLYARTVAVGAAMAAPLFAATVQQLIPTPFVPIRRPERCFVALVAATFLGVTACVVPVTATAPGMTPNRLDAQLDTLPKGTVILNDYSLGGWLLWRHPALSPVIDGRTEVFDPAYVRRYLAAFSASEGWPNFVSTTGAHIALVAKGSTLSTALQERLAWTVVGSDAGYCLLRAPQGAVSR